ncbi:MAG: hypothetical protein ACMXX9_02970 [Candidatus Woesearchaeota archaeon]
MDYVASLKRQGIISNNAQQAMNQALNDQDMQAMLMRLAKQNRDRITSLEKEVSQLTQKLSNAVSFIEKMKDTETVANARQALQERRDRPPADRPIDRNNVAPSQVQLENIFYVGRR